MLKHLFAAAALMIAAPALLAAPAGAQAVINQPAPAFTATDSKGRSHSLSDFRGRTVVLEWTNQYCPFVEKFYTDGDMQRLQADARKQGVVWLTVNSGAPGKQGHVTAAQANDKMKREGFNATAYLLDHNGTLGRSYGARTTPHMFVIDPMGVLVYAGGIDNVPSADPADIGRARNFVRLALADIAAGNPVATPTSRPYGCSVKY